MFLSLFGYIVTNCTGIGTSLDSRLSLCLSHCFSVYGSIIGNLHAYELARSAHSACNFAIYIYISFFCFLFFSFSFFFLSCIRTSFDSYFFLHLRVWVCVVVSDYIITHCMCKCTSLDPCFPLSFSLNVSVHVRLYWLWFYVYSYVCWSAFVSLSLSLSFCLCQCPSILSAICMYVSERVQLTQRVISL